jgi:Concanavalin A-like lectin/glucanases superfamily
MLSSGSRTGARIGRTLLATAAVAVGCAAPAAADRNLAGQWRFDERDGQTVQDDGPFGLHGVLGASALTDGDDPARIPGAAGGALRFAASSYVHVADGRRLDLPTLTVEAVARAAASPCRHRYLVAPVALRCFAGSYGLYTAGDGGLAFYVFDGERYHVSASARAADVWDGAWHRVTGMFDGAAVRAFVDGHEIGSALSTPAGTGIEYESLPEDTYFGSYVGSCRLPFGGDMDSVRISSDARPPAAVAVQAGATGSAGTPGTPGTAETVVAAPFAAATAGRVIDAAPPTSSCTVHASRRRITAKRRSVVTVRAVGVRRRLRLSVRRVATGRVVATRATNAAGSARLVLKVGRSGRLRVGVVGRAGCTPAFIRVSPGR